MKWWTQSRCRGGSWGGSRSPSWGGSRACPGLDPGVGLGVHPRVGPGHVQGWILGVGPQA